MNEVLEFTYRVDRGRLVRMLLLTAFGAVFLSYCASANDRGMTLIDVVTLPSNQATVFMWVMAAANGWLAVLALVSLAKGVAGRDHVIRLTADELTAPKGFFFRKPVTVPLDGISKKRVHSGIVTRFLNLKTVRGRLTFSRQEIGPAAFDALNSALDDRIGAARHGIGPTVRNRRSDA